MTTSSFKTLPAHRALAQVAIRQPENNEPVSDESPAMDVMTDFARVHAVTIAPAAPLFKANETMIDHAVRQLLVVSEDQRLLGVISTRDTLGERPMQLLHQREANLFELTVADLMHPVSGIDVLDFNEVRHAVVGDIVATLKQLGQQHVLVIATDPVDGSQQVRGVFSATQIGRQLGVQFQPFETARTFAEIGAALSD